MKDTIITAKRKRTELITLLILFILCNLVNLYAIIIYNSPVIELLTSLGFVVAATAVVYAIWTSLRLLVYGIKQWYRKGKTRRRAL